MDDWFRGVFTSETRPVLDPDDPKVRWAVFGKQVEEFLQSDIGDYLLKRAERERVAAMEDLSRVSPWRRRRIQELQNRVKACNSFIGWLGEAVAQGHQAIEAIDEERHG